MNFIDLQAQRQRIAPQIDAAIGRVLSTCGFIMGPEVTNFEKALAAFAGARHALGCANGTDALLRAILTPNAAMEAGYRTYRVQMKDGETLDGFFVSEDENTIVLRQPNLQDQRISKDEVRRADFTQQSLMPEGLLDALAADDVRDLFAYLKALK